MNVTRRNFYDLLPELEKAVKDASFVAIDGEFTGIDSYEKEHKILPFDTPQQCYEKQYQSALNFLMLQCGVCIFHFDKKENRYSYEAFNFYLFPQSGGRGHPSLRFQCQSSSMAFLAKNGFDFNKTFGEGIPFMTQIAEERLRQSVEEAHSKMSSTESCQDVADIPIPDKRRSLLENHLALIEAFLDGPENKDEFVLNNCTAFVRKLLYQEVPKKFGNRIYMEPHDEFSMLVAKNTTGIRQKKIEERKMREMKEIKDAVGFSRFIKFLSESRKLIVGHFCLLDILHIVNSFLYPLPEDYSDFKDMMHTVFPRILDTKHMAEAHQFNDVLSSSVLGSLLKTLSEPPFVMPEVYGKEDRSYDLTVDKSHEAGYDAFITGKKSAKSFGNIDDMSDVLKTFENRLFLPRIEDIAYIQLGGPDCEPPRNHVFHLTFPQEWGRYEINELFEPFGSISVCFLDDTSAFVALLKRNNANIVLKTIAESTKYKILPFTVFQKQCGLNLMKSQTDVNNSSHTDSTRKRKGLDMVGSSQAQDSYKKHCSHQQASEYSLGNFDPGRNEDIKGNASGLDRNPTESEEVSNFSAKLFPENDKWE